VERAVEDQDEDNEEHHWQQFLPGFLGLELDHDQKDDE
jgi:hypothetical protein